MQIHFKNKELNMTESTENASGLQLKQRLGLMSGVAMVIGNIIGSGIFLTPSGIIHEVGSPALSLIIWTVSGLVAFIGALCFAELGTTIVKSGSSYAYILEAFGPMLGFVRVWLSIIIIEPTVQAAIAITFANYLIKPLFPDCEAPFIAIRVLGACCLLFICAINSLGVKESAGLQLFFAVGKVVALVMIIVLGIKSVLEDGIEVGSLGDPWAGSVFDSGKIGIAMYSGLYAFAGFDTLNFMTEELKSPYLNLPRSIYISLPFCTVIYLLTNVAYLAVLKTDEMAYSDAIALTFASKTLGSYSWIMSIFVASSTFGTLNSSVYSSSRLFYVAAREKQLPSFFSMIHPEYITPIPSLFLTTSLSLAYLCVPNVFDLIEYYSFMYWLTIAMSVSGLIYLRFVDPNRERPIKFNLALSFIFCLICIYLVIVPFVIATTDSVIGTVLLLIGFPVYFLFVYRNGKFLPSCFSIICNFATCNLQKIFYVLQTNSNFD